MSRAREIRLGDVYWIEPAVAPAVAPRHPHPYVIVQPDVFNRARIPTTIGCALTSNLRRAGEPGAVLLDDGEAGLPRRSVVIATQIDTLQKAWLGAPIGTLSAARVEQILAGLRFVERAFQRR